MLRTIIVLQGALFSLSSGGVCAASPSFHPQLSSPPRIHSGAVSSSQQPWSTRRRSVAFMVPRGGGSIIDDSDDIDGYSETDEEYGSVVEDDEETCDYGNVEAEEDEDEGGEPLDPISRFSFLSTLSRSQSSFASAMVHYASIFIRVTRRTCRAGARAVIMAEHEEGNEDDECDVKPVVHTLLGRTAHVFGEMYHAALTPEDEETDAGLGVKDESAVEGKQKKRRKRRRRSENQHRHHGHKKHRHQYTASCPTTIVCNGGGMEPSPSSTSANHAILQLAKQYNINTLPTNEKGQLPKKYTDSILPSSKFTLNEALQKANSNARFLVCYISKGSNKSNSIAIPNLLSSDVVKLANRKPLGKKQNGDSASYYIWITDDDKDVELAMKRLKVKPPASRNKSSSKKKKSLGSAAPILAIIYPASTIDPSGRVKAVPKVLAQHHCHPPPSTPETLGMWMNTLRKRHLKEYAKLQHLKKEMEFMKERTQGYVSSLKEDKAREQKEKLELQQKKEEEEKELERKQKLEDRRAALKESLVEEPEVGAEGVITLALRFTTGNKRDQRRFVAEGTYMNDVFNWIDAVHGLERETVELSTMNGAKTFRYVEDSEEGSDGDGSSDGESDGSGENVTLEEAGLGKMTALRVSEIVVATEEEEEDKEAGEEGGPSEGEEESDKE